MTNFFQQRSLWIGLIALLPACDLPSLVSPKALNPSLPSPLVQTLDQEFHRYCWITYTPSTFDPTVTPRYWPSRAEVEADLQSLRAAGIQGLVTYRADYVDRDQPQSLIPLPELAADLGFEGLILGIWDPLSESEWNAVGVMQHHPLVRGFVVGNEGLGKRYDWHTLETAIVGLRNRSGKPVTTSEELPDYIANDRLRQLGDWVFPNAHPYFAEAKEPLAAVEWTDRWFHRLDLLTTLPVVFKEVGLPTDGDPAVSETAQADYYQALADRSVAFVFFTAFDLPWKRSTGQARASLGHNPEPHWGLFKSDRSPKQAAKHLQGKLCHSIPVFDQSLAPDRLKEDVIIHSPPPPKYLEPLIFGSEVGGDMNGYILEGGDVNLYRKTETSFNLCS